jgi:hypothetical protein
MSKWNRRQLLAALSGASLLCGRNVALTAADDVEWNFPLLGDLHFDRLEHHDFDWLRREHPGDVKQVENYSRISRELMPKLLELTKTHIDAATRCVIQLGDLIEGLCGTPELAARQAREAIELVRGINFGRPFLFTKGNHDVTGPGSREVYNDTLVRFLGDQTEQHVRSAAFDQSLGGVRLVFYDAYDPRSLKWFAELLAARPPRRLIVVIHPPVVPYNARSTWHVYSQRAQQAERKQLLELLGQHRAVVLCGHLHKYSFLIRRTTSGRFAQLALSSVASTTDGQIKQPLDRVEDYGPQLVELEPSHSPDTVELRREQLNREKPHIEQFQYAETWGRAVIRVRGLNLSAELYRGLDRQPWRTIDLTAPLS